MDRRDVDTLADWFSESKSYWSASQLLSALFSNAICTDNERMSYLLKALASLKHVDSQTGALAIEVNLSFKLLIASRGVSPEDAKRQADVLIAVSEMDVAQLNKADTKAV